ncbi:hypothetical protein M409DRAFT_17869 [Zasmidium cellare ATCC 36951]|uniref:Uncharacterized protein n=1 Tax=Zasmidium cellare ATCC 36951 TaxID=1080233 RepID=A0A6A6CY33_ZASCE|nr:uncharacterized protein M409DRAFT_17869 [Zasmidium cellare ATCC 36951]KAF2171633.1 hypothetical protein M409DRAFT_17869 [Zasmidium cellare ATCC 36951]
MQSLRLTTKRISSSATKALFKHVEVKPTEESCRKCLNLMEDRELSRQVTSIAFHTSLSPGSSYGDEDEYAGLIRGQKGGRRHIDVFYEALSNLSKFEKLKHISINFAERCIAGGDWINEAPEDITVRSRVLRALTEDTEYPEKLHSLSIRNLQDLLPDVIAESGGWKKLLGKLDSLGLWITNEGDEAAPESNMEYKELHEFYRTELKRKILVPVREQLKELKLYSNEVYWGHYPHFDLQDPDMHFPKLETLAIGKLAFVHDWQVDWILSHGATLKGLIIDDCPILIAGREFQKMDNAYSRRANSISTDDDQVCWTNPVRWHTLFRRFKYGLPHLRHFAIRTTASHWVERPDSQDVDSFRDTFALENNLQVSRYCLFDAGIGPSQVVDISYPQKYEKDWDTYPGAERMAAFDHGWEDEMDEMAEEQKKEFVDGAKFPDCWSEDWEALGELMAVVEGRK